MEGPGAPRAARFGLLVAAAGSFGPAAALTLLASNRADAVVEVLPAVGLSLAVVVQWLVARRRPGRRGPTLLLALLLGLCVPVLYAATGVVIRALGVPWVDAGLWGVDARFLGWLFPEGQMSLAIDRSPVLGPQTTLGRVLTEFFQWTYVTYYVWGYGLLILLLVRFGKGRDPDARRHLGMFLCAWVGAYLVNYVLYVLVPAIGPFVAFADRYEHALEGLWATTFIRETIAANQVVPDCFPSGHTALSWITAIVALRFAPRYGRWALAAAVLITLATVGLRYHYAVDLVAAIPLVLVGLWWGGFLPLRAKGGSS